MIKIGMRALIASEDAMLSQIDNRNLLQLSSMHISERRLGR